MSTNQEVDLPKEKTKDLTARANPAVNGYGIEPKTFDELVRFAGMIARSDLCPKDYKDKPENVMVAMQMGLEVGLKPMQAVQNIAVINGRPSIWGDAVLALIQGTGRLEEFKEWTEGTTAFCTMKRIGYAAVNRSFSDEDARAAGLLNKQGPWTQYKARMRQMRARSWAARDAFADVLKGLYVAEEAEDIPYKVTAVPGPSLDEVLPKRKSEIESAKVKSMPEPQSFADKVLSEEPKFDDIPDSPNGPTPEAEQNQEPSSSEILDPEAIIEPNNITKITDAMKTFGATKEEIVRHMQTMFGKDSLLKLTNGEGERVVRWLSSSSKKRK